MGLSCRPSLTQSITFVLWWTDFSQSKQRNLSQIKYRCRPRREKIPPRYGKLPCPNVFICELFLATFTPNTIKKTSFALLFSTRLGPRRLQLFFYHRISIGEASQYEGLFVNVSVCIASLQRHIRMITLSSPCKITVMGIWVQHLEEAHEKLQTRSQQLDHPGNTI